MALTDHRTAGPKANRGRKLATYGVVAVAHAGLLLALGHMDVDSAGVTLADPMIVELVRPDPPPPPPPPLDVRPTPERGGGAPKAPSVVRPVPQPVPEPEVVAPPTPAREQPPLVIGRSDEQGPTPGLGQGGEGQGTGRGVGEGDGDSRGQGPRLVRGPTQAELRAVHPREAFRRRQGGRATLSCQIRLDTRLEACRVVSESPQGLGFGEAALLASRYFRFEPPVRGGQRVAGASVQVGVEWP